jgi:hypothetical protein
MARTTRTSWTIAAGLLILAMIAFLAGIVLAIPNGHVWLFVLGGTQAIPLGVVLVLFGPLALFAGILAREMLHERPGRVMNVSFLAWFILAALTWALIGFSTMLGVYLAGLIPLALAWYGIQAAKSRALQAQSAPPKPV